MTEHTMLAVVRELNAREINAREINATYEHPGYIHVPYGGGYIAFGDICETVTGDVMTPDGECIETIESSIPRDSTDVKAIADHIACYSHFERR